MTVKELKNGPTFFEPLTTIEEPIQFNLPKSTAVATAFPVYSPEQLPASLVDYMCSELNSEIEAGNTYPHYEVLSREEFVKMWFHSFCVVLLKTEKLEIDDSMNNWDELFLGTFYIKPNYPGRCSHNCNAGFLVGSKQRNQKVGYRLGQVYLKWAPLLGYKYSVFNLVFVSNVASWKLWDKFKFDRIGYVPKVAVLKGHTERVDAIIFGKDLTQIEPEIFDDLQ
ncbi:LAFE_0G08944g1_1 [Lachancea fermentati]|uniref:LAFE_0G08944g1_1 n=1 Tax=Lachancea fermentati TaxID=4955 RepID=A0A1G4MI06_LACFM|nr:LAFE_0G08944g1_1 [Lachancea fermentati]